MLFSLTALAVAASTPVLLWQNVAAGMTVDELQAAQPATRPIPADQKARYLGGCTHTSGTVSIMSTLYDVCFELQGAHVVKVNLHRSEPGGPTMTYTLLKPELAAKYGAAVLDQCAAIAGGRSCKTIWKANGIVVTAVNTVFLDTNSISINYELSNASSEPL